MISRNPAPNFPESDSTLSRPARQAKQAIAIVMNGLELEPRPLPDFTEALPLPGGNLFLSSGYGTGFFVDRRGHLITCAHVIEAGGGKRKAARCEHLKVFVPLAEGLQALTVAAVEAIWDMDLAVLTLAETDQTIETIGPPAHCYSEGKELFSWSWFYYGAGGSRDNEGVRSGEYIRVFRTGLLSAVTHFRGDDPTERVFFEGISTAGHSGSPLCYSDSGELVGMVSAGISPRGLPSGLNLAVTGVQIEWALAKMGIYPWPDSKS